MDRKKVKSVEVPQAKDEKNYINGWDFHEEDDA